MVERKQTQLTMAVAGVGAMGLEHCATIVKNSDLLRLTAVCDNHEPTAHKAGEQFNVPWFTDVRQMAQSRLAAAVLVATPHPLHAALALPCMDAGMHVLTEKPLSEAVSTADDMLASAATHKVVFAVMFQLRADPVVQRMLQFAREGGLGRIIRTGLVVPEFRSQLYFDSNPWRATWRGEGGGVLLNQAPHLIDIFVNLGGMPQAIYARCETRLHDIEVEDTAEALLRYGDGGSGYIHCSTVEPNYNTSLEVVGEKGSITMRGNHVTIVTFPDVVSDFARATQEVWGRPRREVVFEGECFEGAAQETVMRNFAGHILHGEPLWCDAASGLGSLEVANGMMLSAALGAEVQLPIDRQAYTKLLAERRAPAPKPKRAVPQQRVADPRIAGTR